MSSTRGFVAEVLNRLLLSPIYSNILSRLDGSNNDESKMLFQFPKWNPLLIVRNLGLLLDGDLLMRVHVYFLFYQMCQTWAVRRNLSTYKCQSDNFQVFICIPTLQRLRTVYAPLAGFHPSTNHNRCCSTLTGLASNWMWWYGSLPSRYCSI